MPPPKKRKKAGKQNQAKQAEAKKRQREGDTHALSHSLTLAPSSLNPLSSISLITSITSINSQVTHFFCIAYVELFV